MFIIIEQLKKTGVTDFSKMKKTIFKANGRKVESNHLFDKLEVHRSQKSLTLWGEKDAWRKPSVFLYSIIRVTFHPLFSVSDDWVS